jgi:putative ABC transport system permease protein
VSLSLEYNLKSVRTRRVSTLLTAGGIALVVLIFVVVMGLAQGLRNVFARTGADDNILVVRAGAAAPMLSSLGEDTLEKVRFLPEIRKDASGVPLVSAEMAEVVNVPHDGAVIPVTIRGVDEVAWQVHDEVRLVEGRLPARLSNEVVVGAGLARQLGGIGPGAVLSVGRNSWTVVGLFGAGGGIYDSEIWGDRRSLMRDRRREDFNYLVAKVDVADVEAARAIETRWKEDPALGVRAAVESLYYQRQLQASEQIRFVCLVLSGVMGFAMVFTGMNTMYGMVAARSRELSTLRVLGFSPRDILRGILFEALVIGLAGGVAGALLGLIANGTPFYYDGLRSSFQIGPEVLLRGIGLAALLGALGGLMPAIRAARLEIVDALRSL